MTHYEPDILHHLSNALLRLYCPQPCQIEDLSEWELRDCLISRIRDYWGIPFEDVPGERTWFRACREDNCSSAMREKMAFLYFAFVEKLSAEEFRKLCKDIMKRKQVVLTPYWDRYVLLYEQEHESKEERKLPKQVEVLVGALGPQEKMVLYEWLKRECENGRICSSRIRLYYRRVPKRRLCAGEKFISLHH